MAIRGVLMTAALVLALVPGCKGMGALGHVASGVGHVASGAGKIASAAAAGAAKAGPVVGALAHVLPVALDVAALAASAQHDDDYELATPDAPPDEQVEPALPSDPCARCADDAPCGSCAGNNGYACELTPPGPWPRCASPGA